MNRLTTTVLLLSLLASIAPAAEFDGWTAPQGAGRIDATGGRRGSAALLIDQPKETTTAPWLSPAQPVTGGYVRASAWMKVRDLYYLDFGFFASASVEFLDGGGKAIKEEPFLLSREIMLAEPLLMQRMETHNRLLSFDWRYGERQIPVPAGAKQARAKFAFSSREHGKAWLDDVQLTFTDTAEPAAAASAQAVALPEVEVRLRTPQYPRNEDPLGHLFFPGEDAVFSVATAGGAGNTVVATLTDSESFKIWDETIELKDKPEAWTAVTIPAAVTQPYIGRLLQLRIDLQKDRRTASRTEFTFGYTNEFKRPKIEYGPEQRYIGNLRSNWNKDRHSRFWMQRGDAMTTNSFHIKNIWQKDQPEPDLSNLTGLYKRPDLFSSDQLNYSVVALINGGEPVLQPEFAHLGHHALPTPEGIAKFMRAAVKRFPQVKYWKALNEMYRADVPGYRQAFVNCQKAFYEAVKAENPDAVVILDNSSVRAEARPLYELGLFNYCDAIDPHLYGQVEEVIFGFFTREKQQLESWGVHKRWISLEADPIPGGGAQGFEPRWVSEELPKVLGGFFAQGGEKMCLLGSGAVTDPTDPFYADAQGGPNFTPTINYFSSRRFVDQVGLKPAVGSFVLGDLKVRVERFESADDCTVVMWSPTGENTVQIESTGGVRVVDNVRTDVKLKAADGKQLVTVGVLPVYVTGAKDMKLALAPAAATIDVSGGGLLLGRPNTLTLNVPDAKATSATLIAPPGVEVTEKTVALRDGKAMFNLRVSPDHPGQLATCTFLYGGSSASENLLVHRFELIRPVSASIWSDANLRDGKPQYTVRVTNTNPIAVEGKFVARAPITDAARPEDITSPFKVDPKASVDLKVVFPAAKLPVAADEQNSFPATVFVYPGSGDADAFAVRERVNLANLPKVRPGLRIDGDTSEWPDWSAAEAVADYVGTGKPGDVKTQMQIAWDRATIYVAFRVRGADAGKSQGVRVLLNNAQDKRTAPYETKDEQRQYTIKPNGDSFALDAITQSKDGHGVVWAARRVADGIDYEIAIPVWEASKAVEIDPGRWLRLSAAVFDADGKSLWQWFGGGKSPQDYATFGAFQLASYGANEWGEPYGDPFAGGGAKRDGYVGLAILPDGNRARVKVTGPDKSLVEVLKPDGGKVRQFQLAVGQLIHTVDVDKEGRLMVGDRVAGVNFYSPTDGAVIPLGPTRGFYPKRHIIEYRSQGVAQDADGNYFVTVVHKRRAGPTQSPPLVVEIRLTKIAGLTLFDPKGNEVKSFGEDIAVPEAMGQIHMFGNMGERAGAFLYADGVAVDTANNLWVTDRDANTLQIFVRKSPGVYEKLPAIWQKLSMDFTGAQVRALPDGRVVVWNSRQMSVASYTDGKLTLGEPTPFSTPIVDLKCGDNSVLTLDGSGNIVVQPVR